MICYLCDQGVGDTLVEIPCSDHSTYHWECIIAHTKNPNSCPLCEKIITNNDGQLLCKVVDLEDQSDDIEDLLPIITQEQLYNSTPILRHYQVFLQACFENDLDSINEFISTDASIVSSAIDVEKHWNALFFALVPGHFNLVKFLIENHRVDHTLTDIYGNSPLDYAIQENHTEIINYLSKLHRLS